MHKEKVNAVICPNINNKPNMSFRSESNTIYDTCLNSSLVIVDLLMLLRFDYFHSVTL